VLLSVAYDGRPFKGWAVQAGHRTVAGELLGALRAIDPRIDELRGASRTDSGVHAHDQRVAFDPTKEYALDAWLKGAQCHLPEEIAIRKAWRVERGYITRAHSTGKTYRYAILADARRDPFFEGRAWRVPELEDDAVLERARSEAALAVGTYDYAAFRGAKDARANTTRTLSTISVDRDTSNPRLVYITVRGNAFMYNMVRILVGTFVDVARRRLEAGAVTRALASKNRRDLGITAPADGLYLTRCELDDDDSRGG
jgi:tRNA pseudouridine38-40 synthase